FLHQGQVCMATSRHIVHRKIAAEYMKKLAEHAAALPVGDPFRAHVAIGPLISEKQLNRVSTIVDDSVKGGAKVGMRAYDEEIFGPVAPVTIAEDDDEAVALANGTGYGLAASVMTGSVDRGMRMARQIKSGMVHINDQTIGDHPGIPMGGMG